MPFLKNSAAGGKPLPEAGDYGVAMIFPQDPLKRMRSQLLEMILSREGLGLLFWREVPVCRRF